MRQFKQCMDKGLGKRKDLCNECTLMSIQQFVDKYDVPRRHFKYIQIKSFIHSPIKTTLEPWLATTEQLTVNHLHEKGQLSMI